MRILHVYPALAKITDAPRIKPEAVTIAGVSLLVYRRTNPYLDPQTTEPRYKEIDQDAYFIQVDGDLYTRLSTARDDAAMERRLLTPPEFGENAGQRPIDGIGKFVAEAQVIAFDPEGWTSTVRARQAAERAERQARDAQVKLEREERTRRETAQRIADSTDRWRDGQNIEWSRFEELMQLHGVMLPIQTLGACRRHVIELSRVSYSVRGKSRPEGVWGGIRALDAALRSAEVTA